MIAYPLQEAKRSVDILVDLDPRTRGPNGLGGWFGPLAEFVNPDLTRRCVCYVSGEGTSEMPSDVDGVIRTCTQLGWQVRPTPTPLSRDVMIIDRKHAFSIIGHLPWNTVKVDHSPVESRQLLQHFGMLWKAASGAPSAPAVIFEDVIETSESSRGKRVAVLSAEHWGRLLARLKEHPRDLFELRSREFEELIAELLAREGYSVHLTPWTRDGGRDVLATHGSLGLEHLYLVECKRWSPARLVGVEIVRALYGVVEFERATAGMLVTTSGFTNGALELARRSKHRLALNDYDDVVQWICRSTRRGTR